MALSSKNPIISSRDPSDQASQKDLITVSAEEVMEVTIVEIHYLGVVERLTG
tara:strand:+ start:278 stop:433 length:156 start_codon:yes stop_codon:yes gene_type:complete